MATRAKINKEVLLWARASAGYSEEETANSAGISLERYNDIESIHTDELPTINQLRKIANKLKRPINFFFMPFVPKTDERKLTDFRSKENGGVLSPSTKISIRSASEYRDEYLSLTMLSGEKTPKFPLSWSTKENPDDIAKDIRSTLGISIEEQLKWRGDYTPLNFWKEAFERIGVLIFQFTIPTTELRGVSVYNEVLPLIILSSSDSPLGRVFGLFHELSHLGLREGGVCDQNANSNIEVFCNSVAGASLIPREHFEGRLGKKIREWDDQEISVFCRDYSVSRFVVLRRILEIGKTTEEFYARKHRQWSAQILTRSSGQVPPYRKTISKFGKSYIRTVLENYYSDRINLSDVSQRLGVKVKHLSKIESEVFK